MKIEIKATHEDKFASMAKQMGRWVDHVLGHGFHKYSSEEGWSPAVNLYEDDRHYCVVVDLAGVKSDKIDIHPEQDELILSGYRPTPGVSDASGSVRLHHMEIDHGKFTRGIPLPEDVDVDRIEAFYKSGFLWIRLPKKA